jgi:hypothetical protein
MEDLSAVHSLEARDTSEEKVVQRSSVKRYFLLALLVSTWIPFAFFILLVPSNAGPGNFLAIKSVFLFLGTAHVPATLYLYTDPEFSGIIKNHRFRYIYAPILLAIITGLLFVFLSRPSQAFILLLYWAWQAFHYGRQNIGLYAFASIAQTGKSPHKMEKAAINLGTILGILGTFKILGVEVAPSYLHGVFGYVYQLGFIAFAGVIVFSLIVYLKLYKDTTLFKTLFFFTSVFFFYPVFISTDVNIAFLSYAIAHGLQYIIFMTVISANERRAGQPGAIPYKNIIWLVIFVMVVGFIFFRGGELREIQMIKDHAVYGRLAEFLFGAILGATMGHFVVDAGAWKLSKALQRGYITKRFNFIFDKEFPVRN